MIKLVEFIKQTLFLPENFNNFQNDYENRKSFVVCFSLKWLLKGAASSVYNLFFFSMTFRCSADVAGNFTYLDQ